MKFKSFICFILSIGFTQIVNSQTNLVTLIEKIEPSVVGIGLNSPMSSPANALHGTGFIIGDGSYVITNYHVVDVVMDPAIVQHRVAFIGTGQAFKVVPIELVAQSIRNDLALLKLPYQLKPLQLEPSTKKPGTDVFFTGYPIGSVLGLYPATHKGIISAVTPDVIPVENISQLTRETLEKLKNPLLLYQLDATAFPGNSGSPLFDGNTGSVIGILNKVLATKGKESVLSSPTGISYAVPSSAIIELLDKASRN